MRENLLPDLVEKLIAAGVRERVLDVENARLDAFVRVS